MTRKSCILFICLFGLVHQFAFAQTNAGLEFVKHYGRSLKNEKGEIILIGSASSAEWVFSGDSCVVNLKSIASDNNHNYISVQVDNKYMGRIKIFGDKIREYSIKAPAAGKSHVVRMYKSTEAQNGQLLLSAVKAKSIQKAAHPLKKKIEFIGNSITCGMGNDISDIPCGSGLWYDQHNAYFAYGPLVARSLKLDFMLSSVSGIGIYRTWNTDHPDMTKVYESAEFNTDNKVPWNFNNYSPDIVSICLGTNDLSEGDGKTPRAAFDSSVFTGNYNRFIETIYKHYPTTKIVLLTSPMLSGAKAATLFNCLQSIKKTTERKFPTKKKIEIFQFEPMSPKGCSYHPNKEDHEKMAAELQPFLKKVINNL